MDMLRRTRLLLVRHLANHRGFGRSTVVQGLLFTGQNGAVLLKKAPEYSVFLTNEANRF